MYASGELMGLLGDDPDEWFAGHTEGGLSSALPMPYAINSAMLE